METELRELMASIFGIAPNSVDNLTSPLTVPTWDSLNHLNLIVAVEERFGVSFTTGEIQEITTYAQLKQVLRNKGLDVGP